MDSGYPLARGHKTNKVIDLKTKVAVDGCN